MWSFNSKKEAKLYIVIQKARKCLIVLSCNEFYRQIYVQHKSYYMKSRCEKNKKNIMN